MTKEESDARKRAIEEEAANNLHSDIKHLVDEYVWLTITFDMGTTQVPSLETLKT
jgi:hypothetical protein